MRESIRYPVRGEHAEEALLVGWICLLAHHLFLPVLSLIPAAGYLVAVLRSTTEGGSSPPSLEYRSLLRRGMIALAVVSVYGVVPLTAGAITFELAGAAAFDPGAGASIPFFLGSTVTLFVLLGFLYALPIALCRYAREGLRGAVPGRAFGRIAGHAAYFVGWTATVVLIVVGWFIGGVFTALPALGPVLAAFCWWYTLITCARRIGLAYAAAR